MKCDLSVKNHETWHETENIYTNFGNQLIMSCFFLLLLFFCLFFSNLS